MNTYSPLFDASNPDPSISVAPALAVSADGNVPSSGTGLAGAVFAPGTPIRNLNELKAALDSTPEVTFTASEIAYGGRSSETTVSQFLGEDADTIVGDGDAYEMGPSGVSLSGFVYIPAGVHQISIVSDDGFELSLGGEVVSSFEGQRAADSTDIVADFEGGLYAIDLLYFDTSGKQSLAMQIDGLPVDQSAFYQSVDDFTNPPADVPLVPVADYHPSYFLGEDSLAAAINGTGTDGRDVIEGKGDDDVIEGGGGDDELYGGYGDDILRGGDGDDVMDGGRGSDVLEGGAGNDTLIARSDAGITRIGQLAIGEPTRGDPDDEVNDDLQILKGYENQPIKGDDLLIGGEGEDTFLIAPQLNAKLDIIQKHVQADGTINWAGVAGENNELHDHWVDSFGIDVIGDYNADEDTIAVIGHTANVYVEHKDVLGDDALESIITVISQQGGGGGAHTQDLIGQVIVHGDLVEKGDIQTDAGVTYGIVDNYADVAEALFPQGETKTTTIDGVEYHGYDTRSPADLVMGDGGLQKPSAESLNGMGTNNLGPVTGDPAAFFENPNFDETMLVTPDDADEVELTRDPFDPLGTVDAAGQTITGGAGNDNLSPDMPADPAGLPGALGYYSFADEGDGGFADARGEGPEVKAFTLYENQALLRTDGAADGPDGTPGGALFFNGVDDFAFLEHDPAMSVTQGTIAMWVRPDDLGEKSMFVSKDHSGTVDGGHFRIGHTDDGGVFLRMAPGDGGSNKAWETGANQFTEGEWAHLAVSFTEDGVTVYIDGEPIPAGAWNAVEGNVASPANYTEAYILQNEEPWVFGADSYKADLNDTAQEFATDDEDLRNEFEGAIAEFGVWGGFTPDDALSAAEINDLIQNGPGAALTNPSGAQPMMASDDVISGLGGNDDIDGGAGDDVLSGDDGDDNIQGGYGDDHLMGGIGNDTLDGGRGSDLLEGGDGDDVLISRADAGEQRIGQLVLDDPSRAFPDPSVDPQYLKLVDWIDQPVVGDDVLVGGEGADHFQFETLINGKKDIILDHVNEDRTIDWMGVAGENDRLHDHWVDHLGIDVIADYNADEDTISVIGHTTQIEVDYKTIDTDGDGIDDDAVSIIKAYSQQGNGGAHDEDLLGYIVVHGDKVEEDDVITNAGVAYGIVDTVDEIQEAVAPTGATKTSDIGIDPLFGYDTRDVDGDPIGSDPEAYSSNTWLNNGDVALASAIPSGLSAPGVVLADDGGTFDGTNSEEILHTAGMAQAAGTVAFSFTADDPGNGDQALLSKDHSGFKDGGHLTAYINNNGVLKVRFQDENDSHFLYESGEKIEAGEEYHLAFTFSDEELALYLNGEQVDTHEGVASGMSGNEEDLVLGASTRTRQGDDDNLQWQFKGTIENVLVLDRPLEEIEALFLAENGGDIDAMAGLYGAAAVTPVDDDPVIDDPVIDDPVIDDPVIDDPVIDDPIVDEPVMDDPVIDDPVVDDPVIDDPVVDDPVVDDPVVDEPVMDDPVVDAPVDDQPADDEEEPQNVFTKLISFLKSLFGLGGDDDSGSGMAYGQPTPDQVDVLLNDIIPAIEAMADDVPEDDDDDDDDMSMAA